MVILAAGLSAVIFLHSDKSDSDGGVRCNWTSINYFIIYGKFCLFLI